MICGDRSGECDTGGLRSNSNTDAVEEAVGIIYLNSPLISEIFLILLRLLISLELTMPYDHRAFVFAILLTAFFY